jgi:hypothetical protein
LWNHNKKFHNKIEKDVGYKCKICNKVFNNRFKKCYHQKNCKHIKPDEPDFIKTKKNIEKEINNKPIPPIKTIKKNSNGIIYLIQPSELVGTNRYKIGMSKNPNLDRCKSYKKGSRYLCIMECTEPSVLELNIKQEFKKVFLLIAGTEYFEGNEKLLLTKFMEFAYKHVSKDNELIL